VNLGVSEIADILDCTEKDVNRALDYWTKKGLLDVAKSGAQSAPQAQEREAAATPAKKAAQTVSSMVKKPESPATPEPKSAQTPSEKNRKEFREITHVTELYLGNDTDQDRSRRTGVFLRCTWNVSGSDRVSDRILRREWA